MAFKSLAKSGIVNFSKYQNILVGNAAFDPGPYELISTTTLSSSQATVSFDVSSLAAQGFKHLQLRITAKTDRTGADTSWIYMAVNNDFSAKYATHRMYGGSGSTTLAGAWTAGSGEVVMLPTSTSGSNVFGSGVIDILDFSNANKTKTMRSMHSFLGAINWITFSSMLSPTVEAMTSIQLRGAIANFVAGSRFSLYGVK